MTVGKHESKVASKGPGWFTEFNKAWAALAAAVTVAISAGLITGSVEVWVSGAVEAVGAALNVLRSAQNAPPRPPGAASAALAAPDGP